jgi:hypothetical protein
VQSEFVEIDKEYSNLNNSIVKEIPKIETRSHMPTKNIKDFATVFNLKNVIAKVTQFEVWRGGFFSSDYSMFTIETEIEGAQKHLVQRKESDFTTLRK